VAARRWSIGELARASGLTVRTLHHYDEIGLVRAGERTASGHRRYTEVDLRRLYRVRALRGLGLSLEEIATVLADDLTTLRELLTAQLRELDAHAERIKLLRHHIGGLLTQLDDMPDPARFMTALELASAAEATFSQEQRDLLHRRSSEQTRTQTLALLKEIRQHQLDGTPVDDPRIQELTRRVDGIGTAIHGGDERVIAAANRLWQDNRVQISRSLDLPAPAEAPDIVDYLQRARQARRTT
jgi:MerR family transcriptional regulator, thiopeptide resistance regulator